MCLRAIRKMFRYKTVKFRGKYIFVFIPITLRPWQTRTHCCRHKCFRLPARKKHFRNILCPQQMFSSLRSMETQQKHHEQQCVCNNVSSFASTFTAVFLQQHVIFVIFEFCLVCSTPRKIAICWFYLVSYSVTHMHFPFNSYNNERMLLTVTVVRPKLKIR